MTASYFLPPGVSFCICDGLPVLMDLGRDRYIQLGRQQAVWFAELAGTGGAGALSEHAQTFAERLVRSGLLAATPQEGRLICADEIEPASRDLLDRPAIYRPSADAGYAAAEGFAIVSASRLLADKRLSRIPEATARWKSRARLQPDLDRQTALAGKYLALTPYFMRTRDACKLHSAALVRFLALFGERADWVFGVRLNPFGAHCWVQCAGTLLNDSLDRVREYRPLLSL